VTPSCKGLHIRVDDDHNPELWFELHIEAGLLASMSGAIETLQDNGGFQAAALGFNWGVRKINPDVLSERVKRSALANDSRELFDYWWMFAAEAGACDGFGGAEYHRVLEEWMKAGRKPAVLRFIIERADAGPG